MAPCAVCVPAWPLQVLLECWDPADAERVVADDWEHDARGGEALDETLFLDALFELVDTWWVPHP